MASQAGSKAGYPNYKWLGKMRDDVIELGKLVAAALGGSLPTYLAMREKAKNNRVAEQVANSEFWRNEVKEIKQYTDEKVLKLSKELDECKKNFYGRAENS
jgi:hypothetical protein